METPRPPIPRHDRSEALEEIQQVRQTLLVDEEVRKLLGRSPSQLRFVGSLASDYALWALAILFSNRHPNPAAYLLSWFLISTRLHSIGVLSHDFVHLSKSFKHRKWFSPFLFWPAFLSSSKFTDEHLRHHDLLASGKDPSLTRINGYSEFAFPLSRSFAVRLFLADITGLNFIRYSSRMPAIRLISNNFIAKTLALGAAALLLSSSFFWAVFLYWIFPLMSGTSFLNRLRNVCEHSQLRGKTAFAATNTIETSRISSWLFGWRESNFHLEHHVFPSLPWFRLRELHQIIKAHHSDLPRLSFYKNHWSVIRSAVR